MLSTWNAYCITNSKGGGAWNRRIKNPVDVYFGNNYPQECCNAFVVSKILNIQNSCLTLTLICNVEMKKCVDWCHRITLSNAKPQRNSGNSRKHVPNHIKCDIYGNKPPIRCRLCSIYLYFQRYFETIIAGKVVKQSTSCTLIVIVVRTWDFKRFKHGGHHFTTPKRD